MFLRNKITLIFAGILAYQSTLLVYPHQIYQLKFVKYVDLYINKNQELSCNICTEVKSFQQEIVPQAPCLGLNPKLQLMDHKLSEAESCAK